MGADWDFESTANKLLVYFERQDQARPEFVDGANAARAWVQVLNDDEIDQPRLATVRALIERGDEQSGTAWIELRLAFEQWLRSRAS